MNRRQFIASAAVLTAAASSSPLLLAQTKPATGKPPLPDNLVWHDVRTWGIEGRAFNDTENYFDRLPGRAKGIVRPEIWNLSRDSAGMSVRFHAATSAIYVRYALMKPELAMPHMPATGVSGLDAYVRHSDGWRWLATVQPHEQTIAAPLVTEIRAEARDYLVHLPLYNGVTSLEIGVPKSADFQPTPPRKDKPILFYGTSITQGGCASRPGMAFTNILARRMDRPFLNFGFSGNGRMELNVIQFLNEIDPAIFVIDCLGNMTPAMVTKNAEPAVQAIRAAHPDTPILMLDERPRPNADDVPANKTEHEERCAAQKEAYDRLITAGVKNLHYLTGENVIGADGEATVDGSHPTDLGMMRYADALEPELRRLLA